MGLTIRNDVERRVNSIHFGSASIMPVLAKLPLTKHDATKWLVDAFQTPNPVMLFLTLHGELEEGDFGPQNLRPSLRRFTDGIHLKLVPSGWKRSFDRDFVIIPSAAGSRYEFRRRRCEHFSS